MQVKRSVVEVLYILLGTCLAGFAIATFILPAKIASGGVNGIATIIYHVVGWDPGLVMLGIFIPLFLLELRIFGKRYGFKSLVGTLLLSFWVSLFGKLTAYIVSEKHEAIGGRIIAEPENQCPDADRL